MKTFFIFLIMSGLLNLLVNLNLTAILNSKALQEAARNHSIAQNFLTASLKRSTPTRRLSGILLGGCMIAIGVYGLLK